MAFPFPFFSVQFDKSANLFKPAETDVLISAVSGAQTPTDLFLFAHGWNNNIGDATQLYSDIAARLAEQLATNEKLSGRTYAMCGVFWPSIKFADSELIPSGAATLNDSIDEQLLKEKVRKFQSLYNADSWPQGGPEDTSGRFGELEKLMEQVEDQPDARTRAVDLVRSVLAHGGILTDQHAETDDGSDHFQRLSPEKLMQRLAHSLQPPASHANALALDPFGTEHISGLGGAAGLRDIAGGMKAGLFHLLNYTTYYTMKARAGDVGAKGVAPLIEKIRNANPKLRLHLIGHSFGCRVVASAVNSLASDKLYPDTMMLLQGAFSHNGFAKANDDLNVGEGAFRSILSRGKVRGPILVTHTRNDKAVGLAYATASRLSGVTAASVGDENDIYGGLGSNGAQTELTTQERVAGELLPVGGVYSFAASPCQPSAPHNLRADRFISSHSDVAKPETAYALSQAISSTRRSNSDNLS